MGEVDNNSPSVQADSTGKDELSTQFDKSIAYVREYTKRYAQCMRRRESMVIISLLFLAWSKNMHVLLSKFIMRIRKRNQYRRYVCCKPYFPLASLFTMATA